MSTHIRANSSQLFSTIQKFINILETIFFKIFRFIKLTSDLKVSKRVDVEPPLHTTGVNRYDANAATVCIRLNEHELLVHVLCMHLRLCTHYQIPMKNENFAQCENYTNIEQPTQWCHYRQTCMTWVISASWTDTSSSSFWSHFLYSFSSFAFSLSRCSFVSLADKVLITDINRPLWNTEALELILLRGTHG